MTDEELAAIKARNEDRKRKWQELIHSPRSSSYWGVYGPVAGHTEQDIDALLAEIERLREALRDNGR